LREFLRSQVRRTHRALRLRNKYQHTPRKDLVSSLIFRSPPLPAQSPAVAIVCGGAHLEASPGGINIGNGFAP
jgi:hypothetical protein